ncbi:MAG: group II intron reverse transcriptase/maturase, partial [Microcystaceae cyanobacterium]
MSQLRQTFLSFNNFDTAWRKIAQNHGCAGVDGETVNRFAGQRPKNLHRLLKEVQQQNYQPLPLRQIFIPKK